MRTCSPLTSKSSRATATKSPHRRRENVNRPVVCRAKSVGGTVGAPSGATAGASNSLGGAGCCRSLAKCRRRAAGEATATLRRHPLTPMNGLDSKRMHSFRLALASALAVPATGLGASATAATTTYSDSLRGIEIAATSTEGTFIGTASGALPGQWGATVNHTPLSPARPLPAARSTSRACSAERPPSSPDRSPAAQ